MVEICKKDVLSNLPERPGQGRGVNIHKHDHNGTLGRMCGPGDLEQPP